VTKKEELEELVEDSDTHLATGVMLSMAMSSSQPLNETPLDFSQLLATCYSFMYQIPQVMGNVSQTARHVVSSVSSVALDLGWRNLFMDSEGLISKTTRWADIVDMSRVTRWLNMDFQNVEDTKLFLRWFAGRYEFLLTVVSDKAPIHFRSPLQPMEQFDQDEFVIGTVDYQVFYVADHNQSTSKGAFSINNGKSLKLLLLLLLYCYCYCHCYIAIVILLLLLLLLYCCC
jgi:hypothetical protein